MPLQPLLSGRLNLLRTFSLWLTLLTLQLTRRCGSTEKGLASLILLFLGKIVVEGFIVGDQNTNGYFF
jgi:hypothetical protein